MLNFERRYYALLFAFQEYVAERKMQPETLFMLMKAVL